MADNSDRGEDTAIGSWKAQIDASMEEANKAVASKKEELSKLFDDAKERIWLSGETVDVTANVISSSTNLDPTPMTDDSNRGKDTAGLESQLPALAQARERVRLTREKLEKLFDDVEKQRQASVYRIDAAATPSIKDIDPKISPKMALHCGQDQTGSGEGKDKDMNK